MQLVDGYYIPDGDLAKHHNARSVIEHDQNLHKKVLEFSTARNHMVDVGGNVGRWSIEFAKHFKIVSAFEPAPYHIDCFTQNCHQYTNINLFPYGLSNENKKGTLEVIVPEHFGSTRVNTDADGHIVLKTLDEHKFNNVDVLKIDVEGEELNVMKGAVATIKKCAPVIVIERCVFNQGRQGKQATHDFLEALGYVRKYKITRDCIYVKV